MIRHLHKLIKMRDELANIKHCEVPFSSRDGGRCRRQLVLVLYYKTIGNIFQKSSKEIFDFSAMLTNDVLLLVR